VTLTTTTANAVLTSDQIAQLVELPLTRDSVAMQTSTVVRTNAHQLICPLLSADAATAGFTPEGQERRSPSRPPQRSRCLCSRSQLCPCSQRN
jgi:hypothetical protein